MNDIRFIGEGPSPREVDSFYHGLREMDQSPPVFRENYPGEFAAMYRANGYLQVYGVYAPGEGGLTLRQSAMRLCPYIINESQCLYGPLIVEDRVVLGGFSWWLGKR